MKFQPTSQWLSNAARPLIIAGPCSAESEVQIMKVAEALVEGGNVQLLRAGVWKPRTRPNSFEGMGKKALPWLMRAEKEYGIPFIIEVANEDHVKSALDAGIRHVWIGARTTVNPFSVQEIANALVETDIPVFVKNPLNPDLQLWIGAIERLHAAGLDKLVAIHRGFSTYEKRIYRNNPNWEIPIELKTEFPDLEIVVDPSHIGGDRSVLKEISQKALDLGFDGLMIETHPNPDEALSDPKQQVFLDKFQTFISDLKEKQPHFEDRIAINQLEQLRKLIDEIDQGLLESLKHRQEIVSQIGDYKADHGVTIFQLERWRKIISERLADAESQQIDIELIRSVWNEIHKASIRLQTDVVNRKLAE